MAREGNNCGVLLKKIAAMFKFSLSALTHIGRQDGYWELLLKYDRDDVHNFKTCRLSFLGCGTNGVEFASCQRLKTYLFNGAYPP